jgi:S-adenosylmethionine hydrolase
LSVSFHGRDLFAPVAAKLASSIANPEDVGTQVPFVPRGWPEDLIRIIYIDDYGNAMTGIRGHSVKKTSCISVNQHPLNWARTFSDVPAEQGFWYENSIGLVELAVNQGSAAVQYGLRVGTSIQAIKIPSNPTCRS